MVKGFSEHEKQIIYDKLISEGKKLFSVFGLKKTSISQLTKAAGIAQGTFYQFFTSKEELFFDILEEEEKSIKQQLLDKVGNETVTRKAFKDMLLFGIAIIDQHPIIKSLFQEESMEQLVRKLPPERLLNHQEEDEFVLSPLIEKWQKSNLLVDKDPAVITGALRGFFTMLVHKEEIGETVYPEVVDLLAECLAAGLVREGNESD